jgi:diamine N-acetyltransferase
MVTVVLRELTPENVRECVSLTVAEAQTGFVASNAQSLAEAYVDAALTPLAIYDGAALGAPVLQDHRMVGFTMYERRAGVGFLMRLMIAEAYQGRGYGRAATLEVIRRLRCYPEVQLIATSYRRANTAAAQLYQQLGFHPWTVPWADPDPDEVYVALVE